MRVRKWFDVPDVDYLIKHYIADPYLEALQTNPDEMANAVTIVQKQNDRKAKFIQWSWYLLFAGLVTCLSLL